METLLKSTPSSPQNKNGEAALARANLPWQGRFTFDIPHHRKHDGFTEPYPFNHGFPERFPIQSGAYYTIHISSAGGFATWAGSLLREGLQITLKPGEPHHIQITKVQETPSPQPVDVEDSLRID